MRSLYPWPIFPPDLDQPAACSLSLQLAMEEWLTSFQIIDNLARLEHLDEISNELQRFLLFSLDNPFSRKAGTLDKLCYYSDELLARSKLDLRETIESLLDEMRDVVLAFRSKASGWKRRMPPQFAITTEVKLLCSSLTLRLSEFFEAMAPFFEDAKSDENVLFFLIERKELFNHILQPKRIEDLFQKLYPGGPTHLKAILCEGYTRRGFADFYAKNEALIESIDWPELAISK